MEKKNKNKKYKDKFEKLEKAPVKGLITSLAVPTIISMLVSAFYNMADSYFVGKIDTTSVAAVGIVFSVMTLLQAVGFFLGQGSGIMTGTLLGEKKKDEAAVYENVAFFTVLGIGVLLAAAGALFSRQMSLLLGATKTTLETTTQYLRIILFGSPFILGSFVLNNQLRYQGSALYSMIGITAGSVINVVLDPLFIFTFKMGVNGAALATIIGQFISFIILILGTYKGENLRVSIKKFKPTGEIYKNIFKNGFPSLSRQGIGTIANIALNFACAPYGDAAIAAMSVYNRVMFLGMAVVIGYGQGFQPVCSFNDGAKKYDRVYSGYKFLCVVTTVIITVFAVLGYIFAPQLISIFRDDADVVNMGARALRAQCFAIVVTGFCTSSNMLMQSLKISGKATIMALARQGIFYIPAILLFPRVWGETGIILAQPAADILSCVLTVFFVIPTVKELKNKIKSGSQAK